MENSNLKVNANEEEMNLEELEAVSGGIAGGLIILLGGCIIGLGAYLNN